MKLYIYPTIPSKKESNYNPYLEDLGQSLTKYFDVVNLNKTTNLSILDLLKSVFSFQIIVFNWIENLPIRKYGKAQAFLFLYFLYPILKLSKVKIIWIMHNIQLHEKEGKLAKQIRKRMIQDAHLIIVHSKEAQREIENVRNSNVVYFVHHPVKFEKIEQHGANLTNRQYDILIWGTVSRYKGILEFLEFLNNKNLTNSYNIKIIGKCNDDDLLKNVLKYVKGSIEFENRAASHLEIKNLIDSSKFVLFPYISPSISSSGVFMDTLINLGTCIGPNKGAFKDLADENLCYVFKNFEDVIRIVDDYPQIDDKKIEKFLEMNSWELFGKKFSARAKAIL